VAKLIWQGKRPYWRSLRIKSGSGFVTFVQGDEVPEHLVSPTVLEQMIADGKMARVEGQMEPTASRSIAVPDESVDEQGRRVIEVDVGIMRATVDSGADNQFGTVDDSMNLRPLDPPGSIPDTAPTRTRKSGKRRK
jgi:hypothetical protein